MFEVPGFKQPIIQGSSLFSTSLLAIFGGSENAPTAPAPPRPSARLPASELLATRRVPFTNPTRPFGQESEPVTRYILKGRILSAVSCEPVADAKIEFWLAGPKRRYHDDHRATLFSTVDGQYRFQCNRPVSYGYRPPHIHLQVSAHGYQTLVTQHYPKPDKDRASFDIVLLPIPM